MLADGVVRLRPLEERDLAAYVQSFRDDPQLGALLGLVADTEADEFAGSILLHSCDWKNRRADNEAVVGIAERFGFVYEGTMRARNLERGVRVDLLMWGLLAAERRVRELTPR